MATISEMGPTIIVGSAKAQGSKVKPIDGLELPRATRARDEATQRMTRRFPSLPSMGWHLAIWVFYADYLGKKCETTWFGFDRGALAHVLSYGEARALAGSHPQTVTHAPLRS
jgi:hypothetical protein